jgi:uncharacterized protein YbaR (Trm112 family)
MIPPEVRALLVCPRCRGDLADGTDALCCFACRFRYRIEAGIPVLLIDEAEPLDEPTNSGR